MRELAERSIPLTVCPMSNCMLKVFPDMASHNIRRLHEAGLRITVNSDDPPYFGGYINENYAAIQNGLGMSDFDLWQMAHNSFTSAFLPEDLRNRYLEDIERHRPSVSWRTSKFLTLQSSGAQAKPNLNCSAAAADDVRWIARIMWASQLPRPRRG